MAGALLSERRAKPKEYVYSLFVITSIFYILAIEQVVALYECSIAIQELVACTQVQFVLVL